MKLSWQTCLRAGVTTALVLLGVFYWERVATLLSLFWAAATPLLVGAVAAYVVNILMSFYERCLTGKKKEEKKQKGFSWRALWGKMRRPVCMMLAFATVAGAVYLLFALILPQLVSCFQVLLGALPEALGSLYTWLEEQFSVSQWLQGSGVALPATETEWRTLLEKIGRPLLTGVSGVMNVAVTVTSSVISGVITVFMALIFAVNILLGKEKLQRQFRRLFRQLLGRRMDRTEYVLGVVNDCFHSYIVGQCVEAVILGGLCALGMLVLQLPYALMIGALTGVTALIPVAGAYIGAAVGAIMIFSVSPMQAAVFLIFLVVLQQIEGNLIYPHTVGSSLGLPGIWVLAAVVLGGGVLGIPGMLTFVPLTAAVYRLLKGWVQRREQQAQIPHE